MIDLILIAIIAVVTWMCASEGAWGAVFIFLSVVFAGLLAMNFFEPAAALLEGSISREGSWSRRWDFIALTGIFILGVFAFRLASEQLCPTFMEVHPLAYDGLRWGVGLLTGYVTMAFLLTAIHTAPFPREFLGFTPERNNLLGIAAPDRQWLGFVQRASEFTYSTGRNGLIFDGPKYKVREDNPTEQVSVWPSFPIRYASRREAGVVTIVNPAPVAPQPGTRRPSAPAGSAF